MPTPDNVDTVEISRTDWDAAVKHMNELVRHNNALKRQLTQARKAARLKDYTGVLIALAPRKRRR